MLNPLGHRYSLRQGLAFGILALLNAGCAHQIPRENVLQPTPPPISLPHELPHEAVYSLGTDWQNGVIDVADLVGQRYIAVFALQELTNVTPKIEQYLTQCFPLAYPALHAYIKTVAYADNGLHRYQISDPQSGEPLLRIRLARLTPDAPAVFLSGIAASEALQNALGDAAFGQLPC